jgi:hypothetical protein
MRVACILLAAATAATTTLACQVYLDSGITLDGLLEYTR